MKCFVLLAAVLAGAGCTDDTLSLRVTSFVEIDQGTCIGSPMNARISRGLLDVGVASDIGAGYIATPVVENGLAVAPAGDVNRQSVFVQGVDIQLVPDANDALVSSALPAEFRSYEILSSGGDIMPGSTVAMPSEVIRPDIARAIGSVLPTGMHDQPLTVRVRAFGEHAGLRLNGGYANFPVYLCKNCLSPPITDCPTGGFPKDAVLDGSPCAPAQDAPTTCCLKQGVLLCGAQVPTQTTTP